MDPLYLVHHRRWVLSARDNGAGTRLAREFRPLAGPLTAAIAPASSRSCPSMPNDASSALFPDPGAESRGHV